MGQKKNIKLHIVTDIKMGKEKKHKKHKHQRSDSSDGSDDEWEESGEVGQHVPEKLLGSPKPHLPTELTKCGYKDEHQAVSSTIVNESTTKDVGSSRDEWMTSSS